MSATSPQHVVELLDRAFNQQDVDATLGFYEDKAVVVAQPGVIISGHVPLRDFFGLAMKSGATAKQIKTRVIEADGIALFLSRWALDYTDPTGKHSSRELVATTVMRKQPGGEWKVLIDNSFGPLVLDR